MDLGSDLIESWPIVPPAHVALTGAGGKTTLMLALHHAGILRGWRTVASTTTRVGAWQTDGLAGFLHGGLQGDKLVGLVPEELDARFRAGATDLLVVEADGSRGKVVKGPADHEPVIPASATHVLALLGADSLDRVIEDVAHRPARVAAICSCSQYQRLTVERAAVLLTSPRGGRKGVPPGAQFAVAVTRIGSRQQRQAARLASLLDEVAVRCFLLPLV